jgi:short-subunit dehydrogenase
MSKYSLSGKKIYVVGANSDIAKALVLLLAEEGCRLTLFSRDTEALGAFAAQSASKAAVHRLDIEDFAGIGRVFAELPDAPDGIIIAAGYLPEGGHAAADGETVEKIVRANYSGIVCLLELLKDSLALPKDGFVLAISSLAGVRGKASSKIYSSAKAGLTAYMEGLAQELGAGGTRVAAVCPGYVRTKMTAGLEKVQKSAFAQSPDEVAKIMLKIILSRKSGVFYTSLFWRLAAFGLRFLPGRIYCRLKL